MTAKEWEAEADNHFGFANSDVLRFVNAVLKDYAACEKRLEELMDRLAKIGGEK